MAKGPISTIVSTAFATWGLGLPLVLAFLIFVALPAVTAVLEFIGQF